MVLDHAGSMTISGTDVTAGRFSVDMTSVKSDQSLRDEQFQGIMDTGKYPTGAFVLSSPIHLGSIPAQGTTITATATRSTDFERQHPLGDVAGTSPLERLDHIGELIDPHRLRDYGIDNPSGGPATTANHGLLEFLLYFSHPRSEGEPRRSAKPPQDATVGVRAPDGSSRPVTGIKALITKGANRPHPVPKRRPHHQECPRPYPDSGCRLEECPNGVSAWRHVEMATCSGCQSSKSSLKTAARALISVRSLVTSGPASSKSRDALGMTRSRHARKTWATSDGVAPWAPTPGAR